MSGDVVLYGTYSYAISPNSGTVTLNVADILNESAANASGPLRLELWLTTTPWGSGSGTNYEVATYRITAPNSGVLAPDAAFSNLAVTIPYLTAPPAGNYYVTLVVAEYTGANRSVDLGYVTDAVGGFAQLVSLGANGSVLVGPPFRIAA